MQQAYQTSGLSESIVAFAQFSRSHGLNVGVQETKDALQSAACGLMPDRVIFKNSLKALFCNNPEERIIFEKLFLLFWDTNPIDLHERKNKMMVQGSFDKKANASVVMLGKGRSENAEEDAKNVSGANAVERLKRTDLTLLTAIEAEELENIARNLFRQMAVRLRRRMKQSPTGSEVNLRRTIRRSIATGGEPIQLFYKTRSPRRQRLIVMLDVSGSMDKYSFFLLRFICALRDHFRQLEAFIFSTSLKRISRALQPGKIDAVIETLNEQADNWSSGTRIGECFQQFNERYGKRMLNGSPVVLILSDGLDTGDVSLLGSELQKIHMRSRKVVWLNPLKAMKGYEPTARGMQAAMPSVDDFRTAHNLESLLDLEKLLSHA